VEAEELQALMIAIAKYIRMKLGLEEPEETEEESNQS